MSHPNSHKITIFRTGTFLSRAQNADTASFFAQSKESIGSYYEKKTSSKIGSGMSRDEIELLMPDLVDRLPTDREFNEKVTEYFVNITTYVPYTGGIELEIGLQTANDQPVSKTNMPIDVVDYIRYRHALCHPYVAISKEAATGNQLKRFYVFDKKALDTKSFKNDKIKDAAVTSYLKIKNDDKQVDMMLLLLGLEPRDFNSPDAKKSELRKQAETNSVKFNEIYDEGDLDIRARIRGMVNTKVLKNIGQRYLITESGEEIGASLDEAIYFFKDETNAEKVIPLVALYQEAMTNPVVPQSRKTVVPQK